MVWYEYGCACCTHHAVQVVLELRAELHAGHCSQEQQRRNQVHVAVDERLRSLWHMVTEHGRASVGSIRAVRAVGAPLGRPSRGGRRPGSSGRTARPPRAGTCPPRGAPRPDRQGTAKDSTSLHTTTATHNTARSHTFIASFATLTLTYPPLPWGKRSCISLRRWRASPWRVWPSTAASRGSEGLGQPLRAEGCAARLLSG